MSPQSSGTQPRVTPKRTLELADRCVKCGLCLPHCPTYRETADESESPRGRIALVQGWLGGSLPASAALFGHLDRCLGCRACERACPSAVAYGDILDAARAHQRAESGRLHGFLHRLGLELLSRPAGLRLLGYGAAAARLSGLLRLAAWLRLDRWRQLRPLLRLAPLLSPPIPPIPSRPGAGAETRAVNLFLGCVGRLAQPAALLAAARLLERLGWRVRAPRGQACCGALFRHNGHPRRAEQLSERNRAALGGAPTLAIASACAAELRLAGEGSPHAEEICAFLNEASWPASTAFSPLEKRVAVHLPCSHRNQLGGAGAVSALLARIPGVRLEPLGDNDFCCGAAGSYLVQQPEMAGRLLARKLRWLEERRPDILVTTNTGCALHLAAGIREAGLAIEVRHPVELLERQLEQPAEAPGDPAA